MQVSSTSTTLSKLIVVSTGVPEAPRKFKNYIYEKHFFIVEEEQIQICVLHVLDYKCIYCVAVILFRLKLQKSDNASNFLKP